jgi:serine/threonine protein kinase
MAPEMLHNNKKGYSAKVDIWSLGCVFIEMFTGQRPWEQDDFVSVMFKVVISSCSHLFDVYGIRALRLDITRWPHQYRTTSPSPRGPTISASNASSKIQINDLLPRLSKPIPG